MVIKVGPVSFNTRNKRVNLDRRTIKGAPTSKHVAYVITGAVLTGCVAAAVNHVTGKN